MIEHAIIMAASPSRQMKSLTRTRPAAMIPALGKPLVAHVMDGFYQAGIRRFSVVVGEREGGVAVWLSSNWHRDVELSFALQGHQRGTASALFAARKMITAPFVISGCDNLVPEDHVADLCQYFDNHPQDAAVLSLYYSPDEAGKSAGVLLDPRGYVMYTSEDPFAAHQDFRTALPVYGFTPQVLDYLDRLPVKEMSGERALTTAIQMMIDDGAFVGAIETPTRIRLETERDLLSAATHLLARQAAPAILSDIPDDITINPPVHIDPGVVVNKNVTLGPNVYLETGSTIGRGAVIRDAVVLGRQVAAQKIIKDMVVYEDQL
nr:NTP transferase domain-containing protein [Anaerolineae bacterium]